MTGQDAHGAGPRPEQPHSSGRADQRRNDERIMQVASRLIAENPATTIQAIADAAGVTRLTVYRRFPNREAMQEGLRAAAATEAAAGLAEAEACDDKDAFDRLAVALVRLVRRYPLVLLRHRNRPGRQADPVDQRLVAVLTRAQSAGVLRPDVPPRVVNAMLFATIAALRETWEGLDDADAARQVVTLLLEGLASPATNEARRARGRPPRSSPGGHPIS